MRKGLYKRRFSLLLAFIMIIQMTVSPFSGSFVYADEVTDGYTEENEEAALEGAEAEAKSGTGSEAEPEETPKEENPATAAAADDEAEEAAGAVEEENAGAGLASAVNSETEEAAGEESFHTVRFYNKDKTAVLDGYEYNDVPNNSTLASVNRVPAEPVINSDSADGKSRFKGWVDTKDGTTPFDFTSKITGYKDFYQYWINLYKIEFNSNGGSAAETQIIENGEKAVKPDGVSRDGYRLDAWCEDSNLSTNYVFGSAVHKDYTLYARWILQCEVTFVGNPIVVPNAKQMVDKGSTVVSPNVARDGYDLDGWYTAGGTRWDFNDPVNSDMSLYAHWTAQKRTVSFDETVTDPNLRYQVIDYGHTIIQPPDPVKDGYKFLGWYTSQTGGQKWNFNTGIENNMYLYAHFKQVRYDLIFNHGRVIDSETVVDSGVNNWPNGSYTVNLGEKIVSSNYSTPTHNKYIFAGWYSDQECKKPWDFDKTVSEADAPYNIINLYAGWKIQTFTINFVTNKEGKTVSPQTVEKGKKVADPCIDKEDYAYIVEWYEESTLKNIYDFSTEIQHGYTLYAKWTDAKKVTFETNGGTELDPVKVVSGTNIERSRIGTVTKEGHTFDDWYEDADLSIKWDFGVRNKIYNDVTMYAGWKVNNYDVEFYDGDKKLNSYTQTVSYGGLVAKPGTAPTKEGYTFKGWYKDTNATLKWDFDMDKVPDHVLKLYAGWDTIKFTVSFDSMSSDVVPSQTVEYNSKLTEPSVTRVGYDFKGWYKNKNFKITDKWNFSTDLVTEDMWLYAYWTVKECRVTFNTNGGSSVAGSTVFYNNKVKRPVNDPTKLGCSFNGWYKDAGCTVLYDFSDPVTGDLTIYAGWIDVKPFKIRAYVDGSNGKISPAGSFDAKKGSAQTFVFTPDKGYEADVLKIDGVKTDFADNKYVLEDIQANHTVSISFRKIQIIKYIISSSCADDYGEIIPRGEVGVEKGKSQTFTLDPFTGYELDYLSVDGIKIEISGNKYIFENVTQGHTIVAYFKEKKIEPIIPPGYYQVKFVVGAEVVLSETVSEGTAVSRPEDPVIKGQIFMGWYDGNRKWSFSDPVTKHMTLTARFLKETVSEDDVHSGLDDKMNISDPDDITMVKGQKYDFGPGLWMSTDSSVVSVGKKTGVAKAKSPTNVPVTITDTSRVPALSYKIRVLAPEMSPKKLTMGVGASEKVKLLYSDGLNIAWQSSNPKIASVEDGLITTKSKGKVKIYAWVNGKKYTCSVQVKDTYTAPTTFDNVAAFTIRPSQTLNLKNVSIGGQKPNKLDWRLTDESGTKDANKSGWLAWDDGVCRVDVNGKLKAKACGTSTVIGRSGDTRVKTIKVRVETIPSKTETYINVGRSEKLSYYKVKNSKAYWDATNLGEVVKLGMTDGTKGRVYGLNVGYSVVSCSYNGMDYQTKVYVENPVLTLSDNRLGRLGENEYVLNLRSGTRFMLDMPGVKQQVIWKSKNKEVAFVDEFGMIEGRQSGNTVVSTKINGTAVKVKVYVTN